MDSWSFSEGYWLLVSEATQFEFEGTSVRSNEIIPLEEGWQIVSYYPRNAIEATQAFSGITENLILAKDGGGRFYAPEFEFSNMSFCIEGKGYILDMSAPDELSWFGDEDNFVLTDSYMNPADKLSHFPAVPSTSNDMSLLAYLPGFESGEIGVIVKDHFVGSGVINNGRCGIAIRGYDQNLSNLEGALTGDDLKLIIWDGVREIENVDVTVERGDFKYYNNQFCVITASNAEITQEHDLISTFPNPFNSTTLINYSILESAKVKLSFFDLSGREIAQVVNEIQSAGSYSIQHNAEKMSTGVYFLRLETGSTVKILKTILIR